MVKDKVIAIDGPAGSGKSTMARSLAKDLNLLYVDTGAMYRALGLIAKKANIPFEEKELSKFLSNLDLKYIGEKDKLLTINDEDLTHKIREHFVSELASEISKHKVVRDFLVKIQRNLAKDRIIVMEGRDIGTVVFPQAFCKIFLTASEDIRAKRRHLELSEKGNDIAFQKVLGDVKNRDERDQKRELAPLKPASDAVLLDTSSLDLKGALMAMKKIVQEKAALHGIK
ncbi:MAG: (d)CMP kinase [Bacteriovoracales bacterium]